MQATLVWFSNADLDLRVATPAGNEVNLSNQLNSVSDDPQDNGFLDDDAAPGCGADPHHVENIFFPADPAEPVLVGEYRAFFTTTFGVCNNMFPVEFVLSLKVSGQQTQVLTGTVPSVDSVLIFPLVATLDGPPGGVIVEP